LDECVFAKSWENDAERMTASIYSYNKGTKKLQLTGENKNTQGGYRFAKFGKIDQRRDRSSFPINQRGVRPYGLG
jgi:hypothetical protein